MARTHRNKTSRTFRKPKTKATQTAEHYALQELEEHVSAPPRLKKRANPKGPAIPDAWDDLYIAAWAERCHLNN